jgi:hypothetical protein
MLPALEHEFVMDVEGVPFKGVIDQVWEVTAPHGGMLPGDLLIDDIKSGSTPPEREQLEEYALWLSRFGGGHDRRIWGRFVDVRNNEIVSAPVIELLSGQTDAGGSEAWERLAFQVADTAQVKASGSFAPRRNNYCNGCPVKHACPIMRAVA